MFPPDKEKISVIIHICKYTKPEFLKIKPFQLSQHDHNLESTLTKKIPPLHNIQIAQKTEYIFMKLYIKKSI